jgi:hypothetical protein
MKHGIYSEMTVVNFEEEDDLVAFGKRMRAELVPVGELELALAPGRQAKVRVEKIDTRALPAAVGAMRARWSGKQSARP